MQQLAKCLIEHHLFSDQGGLAFDFNLGNPKRGTTITCGHAQH